MNTIQYLNTDLDLRATFSLDSLVGSLKSKGIYHLNCTVGGDGNYYAMLELGTEEHLRDPEATISGMLDAIESLEPDFLKLWAKCDLREFNIGYDCGEEPWAFNNGLSNSTLSRLAKLGATLRITIYPAKDDDLPPPEVT